MTVRATRVRRLRIRRAISRTLLASAVLAAGLVFLSIRQQGITLVVDGRPVAVPSMRGSVGQLLQQHGIAVDRSDQVVPSPSTTLADGMTVTVDRTAAESGTTGSGVGIWVVEGAGRPATLGVAAELAGGSSSGGASVGRSPASAVSVVVKGKEHDVLTNAPTVGELLSAMGIKPDGDDRVLPPPSTPLRSRDRVRFAGIRRVTRTVERPVPFMTSTTVSEELGPGEARIVLPGEKGTALETHRMRIVNGEVVGRRLLDREVIAEAVTQEREVGPAVLPDPTGSGGSGSNAGGMGHAGTQSGTASWYDPPWSGLTAAHPWLPFGTIVTATNLDNGRSVTVRINDRGPYADGRIIDLSPEAFRTIAPLSRGVADVGLSW